MITQIKIDGQTTKVEIPDLFFAYRTQVRWVKIMVFGKDITGRECWVAQHTVPAALFNDGGKCRTGGCEYESGKITGP